jgi:hypothetical protein
MIAQSPTRIKIFIPIVHVLDISDLFINGHPVASSFFTIDFDFEIVGCHVNVVLDD